MRPRDCGAEQKQVQITKQPTQPVSDSLGRAFEEQLQGFLKPDKFACGSSTSSRMEMQQCERFPRTAKDKTFLVTRSQRASLSRNTQGP